jgi:hypothetical protein
MSRISTNFPHTIKEGYMLQAKFSIEEEQARFLNDYKAYGFKDKNIGDQIYWTCVIVTVGGPG